MTTDHSAQLLSELRTGFLTTRISRTSAGTVLWRHTPGPDRSQPFPPLPAALPRLLARASGPDVTWLAPVASSADEQVWETNGQHSLADALETGTRTGTQLEAIGASLGARLRRLHELTLHQDETARCGDYPRHPGLSRLRAWLEHGRGPRAATAFRYRLRSQLGTGRWNRLNELTHGLLHPSAHEATTVLHGWFSMGGIVLSDRPGATTSSVLCGPDACMGLPETDLGCLVGELTEYRLATRRQGISWPVLDQLQRALLTHYGPGADTETIAAAAILRIATHAHDYASYVGWSEQLHGYVPMLSDLLDSDQRTVLQPA
ncbi:hypothetical protein [Streptomyces rochei]|uniref:hypothetical protein n=1 Tax=Streptomyces rochei TaxID=1928 RepID=UPI0036CE401A